MGKRRHCFPTHATGTQAVEWLKAEVEEENKKLEGRQPGRYKFALTLDVEDMQGFRGNLVKELYPNLTRTVNDLRVLADYLEAQATKVSCHPLSFGGGYEHSDNCNDHFPCLVMPDGKGVKQYFNVLSGTRFEEFAERICELCKSSKWEPHEMLSHVMCGSFPRGAIISNVNMNGLPFMAEQVTITLKIPAPTTAKAVSDFYKKVLKRERLDPKGINKVQRLILILCYEMPEEEGYTWEQRYERWLEWCDVDANLPRYSENTGVPSLQKEYGRALERSGWWPDLEDDIYPFGS